MKKIKSFTDVNYILINKIDVYDTQGHVIPFVRFCGLTLITIVNDVFNNWTYQPEH